MTEPTDPNPFYLIFQTDSADGCAVQSLKEEKTMIEKKSYSAGEITQNNSQSHSTVTSKKYHMHSDQSHGWLKVPMTELEFLGIAKSITKFSFIKGEHVYLEEDCNATLFCDAKQSQDPSWELDIISHTAAESSIRGFEG